eukprot:2002471-Lingulodinium_polyedra.AAC.1
MERRQDALPALRLGRGGREHRFWQCPCRDAARRAAAPDVNLAAPRRRMGDGQARAGLAG